MIDFFQLLGMPERFDLDVGALERAFLDRSRDVHPDRHANAPAAERVEILTRSMALNEAYQTLKRPVRRAEYLLGRAGVTIGANEQIDPTRLLEVLELREELEAARHHGRLSVVAELERTMKRREGALVASLAPSFARVADGDGGALAEIKSTLIELRYVARYLEECGVALDEDAA